MNRIPKHIVDGHKKGVEQAMFYGVPVSKLDRDELLAMIGCLSKQVEESKKRAASYLEMFSPIPSSCSTF